jgi:ribosome-associated toxin RatA of RatAB toxin-antitoxin module
MVPMLPQKRLASWITVAVLGLGTTVVRADDETSRLLKAHATERYNVSLVGASTSIRAGGGMTAVNAPLAEVRKIVLDFGHYAEFMPRFKKSRVVGRNGADTDVYLQVEILHGAATIWAVTRFTPPRPDGSGEVIEGKMGGQGNVDDLRSVWHLVPVDDTHTILKLELLIVPKVPVPGSVVTGELEYAADKAVSSARDKAEAAFRAAQAAAQAVATDAPP